jgi:hypothetical protein
MTRIGAFKAVAKAIITVSGDLDYFVPRVVRLPVSRKPERS